VRVPELQASLYRAVQALERVGAKLKIESEGGVSRRTPVPGAAIPLGPAPQGAAGSDRTVATPPPGAARGAQREPRLSEARTQAFPAPRPSAGGRGHPTPAPVARSPFEPDGRTVAIAPPASGVAPAPAPPAARPLPPPPAPRPASEAPTIANRPAFDGADLTLPMRPLGPGPQPPE
jgi:hypothetical protein